MAVVAQRCAAFAPTAPKACWTLAELYRDHFDFVVRVAHRLGGHRILAEDVAQDVFIIVGRRLDAFEPRANITTWLYAITFNVVRTTLRRLHLEARYRADETEGLNVAVFARDPIEVHEASALLEAILESMSAPKREAFLLAEIDELSCAEIARVAGIKEATVWSRLHYARREFADELARHRGTDALPRSR